MAKYLSQEWQDKAKELAQTFPERPGATARMAYHVNGGPEGDIHYVQVIENGKVTAQFVGDVDDADITLILSWDDSVKVQKGDLDANAAFMQGRIKTGPGSNMGKFMALLPLTMSPEYKEIQEKIRAVTEY